MSAEPERVHSVSDADDISDASMIEVGKDQMSETLADPLNGQAQELDGDKKEGCFTGDHEMEKVNEFTDVEKQTESVNGGLDLCIGTQNVDIETKETEKEVELDMVSSHGPILSDVKVSDVEDLSDDSKLDGSVKQGTKVDNFEFECFVGLEPHDESKDESILDDDNAHVTAELKLSDSDLVWAKVRSHPWWPGQVFDASVATDQAKKYFKKGSFLVTYFGDCTFAWNDASRIKPFRQNFSQMAKQSTLPDFCDAIDFALEEVSRRIEFGLSCSCISEEVHQEIKTQNIINPGIREDSSRIHGGDKVSSAIFFEPANLVNYVKCLACSPSYDATDELQFVSQRAKLLAFNRWKGYTDLPEFETLQGSVESAPKISPAEEKSSLSEMKVSVPEPKKTDKVYTKRRKIEDQDECKHDGVFEYEDTTVQKKKEKTLAEFIAEKRLSRSNGNISDENSGSKPDCEKKRKVVYPKLPKSTKKIKANLKTEDPGSSVSPKNDGKYNYSAGDKITPEKARSSFGIGKSILKVANQMHSSTPTRLIPCSNSTSKMTGKNNGNRKSLQDRPKAEALSERDISPSPNETHSSPNEKHNPISIDHLQSGELEQVIKETPSTNLVEDSMLEPRDLKDSSKKEMVNEDKIEAANNLGEVTIEDSKNHLLGLEDLPGNKNCSDGSGSCYKEDSSAQ